MMSPKLKSSTGHSLGRPRKIGQVVEIGCLPDDLPVIEIYNDNDRLLKVVISVQLEVRGTTSNLAHRIQGLSPGEEWVYQVPPVSGSGSLFVTVELSLFPDPNKNDYIEIERWVWRLVDKKTRKSDNKK